MDQAVKLEQVAGACKPRILLVDEHVVTAEIERSYLIGVGFDVVLASDGEEAVRRVREEEFDLIIVDTSFRGDKGVDTLKSLKRSSKNAGVKAIVTGLSFPPPLKKKVREAGADEIFIKPAPRPQVLKEIKKLTLSASRGTERILQALSLVLKWGDEAYNCQTLDLSADGVHLSILRKSGGAGRPSVGEAVEMDIQLTESESLSRVTGIVMRHTAEGFGVRFEKMKKADQKKLDKYILRHSLEQAASHYYL
jgi:DNA-binding response OmpR family regulator